MCSKKHIFAYLTLILLATYGASAQAPQTPDTTHRPLPGDAPRHRQHMEANVLGAPVYYDTLGNVIGHPTESDGVYHRPRHHFLNRRDDMFNRWFCETTTMLGLGDVALGLQAAYVPNEWGLYTSWRFGMRHNYLSVGPVWRMSDYDDPIDYQLYGGLTFSRSVGFEVGMRFASTRSFLGFGWTSASIGLGVIGHQTYLTAGLSITLSAATLFFFL